MNHMLICSIRLLVSTALAALGISVAGTTSSAYANEVPGIASYTLPINRLDSSIDLKCNKDSTKLFRLKLKIKKGFDGSFYADGRNVSKIYFYSADGRELVDVGYAVDERTIEFTVVPTLKPRTTKPDRTKPMYVVAMVEAGLGPDGLKVGKLSADCLEAGQ